MTNLGLSCPVHPSDRDTADLKFVRFQNRCFSLAFLWQPLDVEFDIEKKYSYSAEFLCVHSPAANSNCISVSGEVKVGISDCLQIVVNGFC